jgi:HEAT repeat protein
MPGFLERMRDNSIANEIKNLADEEARNSAMWTLRGYGIYAVPALIDVLADPSRRAYATVVLSEIGEPAIPALIGALGDDSKKSYASVALEEMGKKKSKTQRIIIPRLIDALADKNPHTRAMAGATLQNFGAPALEQFIPSLINSLGNADAGAFAANVLISIGKPAVGPLQNAFSDEGKQEWASAILREIAKKDNTVHVPVATSQKTTPVPAPTPNQSPKTDFCKYCGASLTHVIELKSIPNSAYCSQCGRMVE